VEVDSLALDLKLVITTQRLFSTATTLTKCSMLTLIYRIIGTGSESFGWFIIGLIMLKQGETFSYLSVTFYILSTGHQHRRELDFDPMETTKYHTTSMRAKTVDIREQGSDFSDRPGRMHRCTIPHTNESRCPSHYAANRGNELYHIHLKIKIEYSVALGISIRKSIDTIPLSCRSISRTSWPTGNSA
jgi:hypothetical protein